MFKKRYIFLQYVVLILKHNFHTIGKQNSPLGVYKKGKIV